MAEDEQVEHWRLAKSGISMLINNRPTEAQNLFQAHPDSIQMAAGYSFVTFMDALMAFEEDKLTLALTTLRDTEKKCSTEPGWFKTVKSKIVGGRAANTAEILEGQIILADTQVCMAILTFLQQEFTGYIKGGWVLRKAWKVYQQTYHQIVELYKKKIGDLNLPAPTDFGWHDAFSSGQSTSASHNDVSQPVPPTNGYKPNLSFPLPHSQSTNSITPNKTKLPRSQSTFSGDRSHKTTLFSPLSTQFSYLTTSLSSLTLADRIDPDSPISPETVARLMGAVCFGYGLLQLGISLLPPSLLRLTNFLGFTGNRTAGISNLMYARQGTDMRAPLALLALLWYHTIIRPFYALDGLNVKAGVDAANLLINESEQLYADSALFLFFKGRIYRLDSNITQALTSFQQAVDNSLQREIKLLALHEVGWCHLIQLDYERAQKTFTQLKAGSRWSKSFYTYLLIICLGSVDMLKEYILIEQLNELLRTSHQKGTQLEIFMNRRTRVFPANVEKLAEKTNYFWKLLMYEILYLWNALPSCNRTSNNQIIADCEEASQEPMPGLAMLIQGECYTIQSMNEKAIESLQKCLKIRKGHTSKDDVHISAYAEFSLGYLLSKNTETKNEGKSLIQHASHNYKDYDFDNKLQVRMDMALKHLAS